MPLSTAERARNGLRMTCKIRRNSGAKTGCAQRSETGRASFRKDVTVWGNVSRDARGKSGLLGKEQAREGLPRGGRGHSKEVGHGGSTVRERGSGP